jgi:hypothetical protein
MLAGSRSAKVRCGRISRVTDPVNPAGILEEENEEDVLALMSNE